MSIALVGGMDKLRGDYRRVAVRYGVSLHHFERDCPRLEERLGGVDAIIVFTYRVSHNAREKALSKKREGIPVLMCHSTGSVSSLKKCFEGITNERSVN